MNKRNKTQAKGPVRRRVDNTHALTIKLPPSKEVVAIQGAEVKRKGPEETGKGSGL